MGSNQHPCIDAYWLAYVASLDERSALFYWISPLGSPAGQPGWRSRILCDSVYVDEWLLVNVGQI